MSNIVQLPGTKPREQVVQLAPPTRASKLRAGLDMLAMCAGKTPEQYRNSIAPNHAEIFREDTATAIEALGADRTIKILEDCLSFAKSQRGTP